MSDGLLYYIIDWIGNMVERAGPAIYKLLALILPYLSPVPVAVYTSNSAATFLGYTPRQSLLFVFVLEAVGLWVTTMLVESVVDIISSRNRKVVLMTIVFSVATAFYIYILINLNVSLKASSESQTLQRVVTLMCFIPLLTGVCNGAYRLRLRGESAVASASERAQRLQDEERDRQWKIEDEERRLRQEAEATQRQIENDLRAAEIEARHKERMSKIESKRSMASSTTTEGSSSKPEGSTGSERKLSQVGQAILSQMDKAWKKGRGKVLSHKELMALGFDKSSAFRHRKAWLEAHPEANPQR